MKATEIRALSAQDLNKKLADLKTELFNLRFGRFECVQDSGGARYWSCQNGLASRQAA